MQSFPPSKAMAKLLRAALAERGIILTHSDCLELLARQYGLPNWNVLAAQLQAGEPQGLALEKPDDWIVTGNTDRKAYRLGLDPSAPGCALIESVADRIGAPIARDDQFACMMQSIVADDYRGGRIRLTASIRTEEAGLGTIWMRIDKAPGSLLRFDNMMNRNQSGPIKATTGWSERSVVLDVPEEAASIHYGFFLKGLGRVWARSFRLDAVGDDVATTDICNPPVQTRYLPRPANLDFARRARLGA